jgi:NAD+ diphosphatase
VSFYGQEILLDDRLSTLAGLASQILHWERQSRFCSHCAGEMKRIDGTWGKRCVACRTEHFPHIHPCVIVLIRRGEEMLLIRKAQWSIGRYSLIAGFLDFGESLEECILREAREEVGVKVTNIRYVGSQSWPFPSQQMIGFLADYAGGDLKPDGREVTEARWFTAGTLPLYPGSIRSIARWILDTYGRIESRKTNGV